MGVLEDFVESTDEKTRKAENEKYLAGLQKRVDRINELETSIEDLGDDELQAKTEEFKAEKSSSSSSSSSSSCILFNDTCYYCLPSLF